MIAGYCVSAPRHHHHLSNNNISHAPTQLRTKLHTIQAKKAEIRAKLQMTRKKVHYARQDLANVEVRLNDANDRLSDTRDRLSGSLVEQKKVAGELVEANKELDATRLQVRTRLRHIYMESESSDLSAIAGTRQAGDIASTDYLMGAIEHKDRALFERFKGLEARVADRKRRQDQLVIQIKSLIVTEKAQSVQLDTTRKEKTEVVADLGQQQGELQQMLDQIDRDEENITSEIDDYLRREAATHAKSGGPVLRAFTGRFSRPADGPITSGFGYRYHPILHIRRLHAGIDFGAPYGSPIRAAADGVVIATQVMRGYGRVVIIDHGGGISTVYAHTSRFYVSSGQRVKRGEVIAAVGATGLATGPHLHFEVRVNGRPVNPLSRL